jgi:GNAT superfamily N-acetyltransferase
MPTAYLTRETDDGTLLRKLHAETFPSDAEPDFSHGRWWVAHLDGAPVAFVGAEPVDDDHVYLSRVGVLEGHRGHGLQRHLMLIAEAAYSDSHTTMVSTTYDNPPSANNFIRLGYMTYEPATRWGAEGTCYWIKPLKK